jgi:hypothetical protein
MPIRCRAYPAAVEAVDAVEAVEAVERDTPSNRGVTGPLPCIRLL